MLTLVAEVTINCFPAYPLEEITLVVSRKDVRKHHQEWLARNKHRRYMCIPQTDGIILVTCNPVVHEAGLDIGSLHKKKSHNIALIPARNLLLEHSYCKISKEKAVCGAVRQWLVQHPTSSFGRAGSR